MHYEIIYPSSILQTYIKQYWYMEIDAIEATAQSQRLIPTGCIEMCFQFAEGLLTDKNNLQALASVSGQKNSFKDITPKGKLAMLTVQFYPHAARLFFPLPMSELQNQTLALNELWGKEASDLEEQLNNIKPLQQKITILDSFLTKRLIENKLYDWNRMAYNIQVINLHKAEIGVNKLAETACLSRKQYERIFKEFVGLSPKQFLKTVRFQYSLYLQQHKKAENIADLAFQSGYYDQAHMTNEYKEFSGLSPKQYFSGCDAVSDYF